MSLHWWHVTAAYAATAVLFGTLAAGAWARHRAAKRRLAQLDPRGTRP
ncbi:MAG TPA: heme exporter protein CcmD [Acetobacteraceae bacterium]|nr:heme exporter protein CcmD [Acetobacteraceae bacterium]